MEEGKKGAGGEFACGNGTRWDECKKQVENNILVFDKRCIKDELMKESGRGKRLGVV